MNLGWNAWGMTSFNEFLVQGANMGVMRGEIAEPPSTRLTWRSPHEAVADLSEKGEPMLLRLHFHPGWNAGEAGRSVERNCRLDAGGRAARRNATIGYPLGRELSGNAGVSG